VQSQVNKFPYKTIQMSKNVFPIPINITESDGVRRENRPVRLGIPFPCNCIHNTKSLTLLDENQNKVPFQAEITAHWHGDSIRWLLIDFFVTCNANNTIEYSLIQNKKQTDKNLSPLVFAEQDDEIIIQTGVAKLHINKKTFQPFSRIITNNSNQEIESSSCILETPDNIKLKAIIDEVTLPVKTNTLRTTINIKGFFSPKNNDHILRFKSSLTFFANSSLCEIDFTLHNPNAAKHPGGFWDLGDTGSTYFKSLILNLKLSHQPEIQWKSHGDKDFQPIKHKEFRLYQNSSGGENWNHHIHIDKDKQSTVSVKGYQLKTEKEIIDSGKRASPILQFKNKNSCLNAHIKQFWQNFPKAISANEKQIKLEVFPETTKSDYELQGGEQKTHSVILDFNIEIDHLEQMVTPLIVSLPLSHYSNSSAMPWLTQLNKTTALDEIIHQGIEGDSNFFIKREKADEYGWRNFGELWADHETLEHGNDDSLVSHYNNQYDPIYGLARQYIITGDNRWFELFDDLARHVIDIDIYHTEKDRFEYNNGLFWHTDHYLDGAKCTHRTYSNTHMDIDHVEQSGGGPGAEHCYTTGLKYYYYLTGNKQAYETVINLTKWIKNNLEGDGTALNFIFNFITKDTKIILSLLKRKKIFTYRYPLTRGTGNYINTLLDSFELTSDKQYLEKAEKILINTFHFSDDIEQRNLIEIEKNWSYTIFLQSVSRYIVTKTNLNEQDKIFITILKSFTHYVDWIKANEKPYLYNSDKLVYPNSTWVAQDIRKCFLLNFYDSINPTSKGLDKATELLDYICMHFKGKDILKSSRVLSILMQNPADKIPIQLSVSKLDSSNIVVEQIYKHTLPNFLLRKFKELILCIRYIKFQDEYRWLKKRLS
jgi:hypothetical protein